MSSVDKNNTTFPTNSEIITKSDDGAFSVETHAGKILKEVQKARKNCPKLLRKSIQEFRSELEYSRKEGNDPLIIFPQEIWEMIFGHVQDVNVLVNCSKTCTTFQAIVNSSNQELLFGKVIPFLFSYLNYECSSIVHVKTLVTCGRVCKNWRAGVESFANNYFRSEKISSDSLDAIKTEQSKYFGDKSLFDHKTLFPIFPKYKKGFMSKGLVNNDEEACSSDSDDEVGHIQAADLVKRRRIRNEHKQMKIGNIPFLTDKTIYPSIMSKTSKLASLKVYGPLLWKVTVEFLQVEDQDAQHIYSLHRKILETCPNLRKIVYLGSLDYHLKESDLRVKTCPSPQYLDIPAHQNLESCEVIKASFNKIQVPADIQFGLLRGISFKLEHLKVSKWNGKMDTLDWGRLTHLEVLEGLPGQFHENTKAPNLHKLSLCVECDTLDLPTLFKCINQFPNLRDIELSLIGIFTENPEEKVKSVPLKLLTANRITSLKISSRQLIASQLIPILFPMVRILTVHYGYRINDSNPAVELSLSKTNIPQNNHYLQFYDGSLMYQSNIWSVLPQLQELVLCYNVEKRPFKQFSDEAKKFRKFIRQGYYLETERFIPLQNWHLERVWIEAKKHIRNKLCEKLSLLQKLSASKNIKCELGSQTKIVPLKKIDGQIFKEVLPIIISGLTKQDAVNCRLVCKSWWTSACHIDFPVYKFDFPLDKKLHRNHFISNIKTSQAAPYFSRNIEIRLQTSSFDINDIIQMLQVIGQYITQVTIATEQSGVPEVAVIYEVCVEVMNNCPELRTLHLLVSRVGNCSEAAYDKLKKSKQLVRPKKLKSLVICGPDDIWESTLDMILRDVIFMCHSHLQFLQQSDFSHTLNRCKFRLDKLEKLVITHCNVKSLFYTYKQALNLKYLGLCVTGGNMTVGSFGILAKNYPNLKILELHFGPQFSGLNQNLLYTNPKHILGVDTAKIVLKDKYQVSLDFLVHLPFLQTLCVTYGVSVSILCEESLAAVREKHWSESFDTLERLNYSPPRKPERDFIQLVKYFKDEVIPEHDTESVYDSNIWAVLRKLRTLEIFYSPKDSISEKTVFFRK